MVEYSWRESKITLRLLFLFSLCFHRVFLLNQVPLVYELWTIGLGMSSNSKEEGCLRRLFHFLNSTRLAHRHQSFQYHQDLISSINYLMYTQIKTQFINHPAHIILSVQEWKTQRLVKRLKVLMK